MEFEKEIKSTKLDNMKVGKAILNAMFTGNFFQNQTIERLKPFNINDQHYNILRILKGKYPESHCPGDIKDVLVNKRGDLTRLLDKLVKMDLVRRQTNEENRRMIDVFITDKGLEFLKKVDPVVAGPTRANTNLTDEEADQLSMLLDKLRG